MRVFSASLATETNTFGPMPTGMASFRDRGYHKAGEHPDHMTFFSAPLWAARARGRDAGWTLFEGMVAGAQPSGTTTRAAYESLRDELLADLRAVLPVDLVLLGLHGAMVADGYPDCEGDLLTRVRALVGPETVIGAELDPHTHLTREMVNAASVLVAFKEYPHTDIYDRALDLVDLCAKQVRGDVKPVPAMVDTGMVSILHTSRSPMRDIVDRLLAEEGRGGLLSASIVHGFPWGDVPAMGTKVLVYADGDQALAQRYALDLANELVEKREAFQTPYPGIDAALDEALAATAPGAPGQGPVVISDGADNAGGGAASDSTYILERLIERGIGDAALGPIWDPIAVRIAFEAGEGARLPMRIGGKVSAMSGPPLDLDCTVMALRRDMVMTGLGNARMPLGDCAWLRAAGIDLVLVTLRNQAMDTDLFTQLGCPIAERRIVVVKSSQHFYASYAKIARRIIYADAPGSVTKDFSTLHFRHIQRPKWPMDDIVPVPQPISLQP